MRDLIVCRRECQIVFDVAITGADGVVDEEDIVVFDLREISIVQLRKFVTTTSRSHWLTVSAECDRLPKCNSSAVGSYPEDPALRNSQTTLKIHPVHLAAISPAASRNTNQRPPWCSRATRTCARRDELPRSPILVPQGQILSFLSSMKNFFYHQDIGIMGTIFANAAYCFIDALTRKCSYASAYSMQLPTTVSLSLCCRRAASPPCLRSNNFTILSSRKLPIVNFLCYRVFRESTLLSTSTRKSTTRRQVAARVCRAVGSEYLPNFRWNDRVNSRLITHQVDITESAAGSSADFPRARAAPRDLV